MLSNKFLIMSFALFAVIIVVSAEGSEEQISDRRFRWPGSDEQEAEDPNEDNDNAEEEDDSADDKPTEDDNDDDNEDDSKESDNESKQENE
ncbi:prostatic spermine-binding protein [Drosophila grimshawi]|uniref:GH17089 n=1 Tax=Drosophila grimshawi TaxID=7222 RepID=B4J042_DROGR|nr:prostatic spermine-binding protein [Drosophila grimshawi]EDV97835.1 GH17089 [Drosophila grimshawi]